MLEPRERLLLLEALRPPEGFRFDQGFGTTYSLDLLALLTAPIAFTWFEQRADDERSDRVNSLEIAESLRQYADRLTIFCDAGRIALPKAAYPQLAFLEDSVVECRLKSGGAFHPKVWALRWIGDDGSVKYRVLCLSRNMAFSRAWDTLLSLDGTLMADRPSVVARNRGLVDFVRALPGLTRAPVAPSVAERINLLAGDLERTEFELPDGISDIRFWPLGIGGSRPRDPLEQAGDRLLIVSPFVTLGRLEQLAVGRSDVTLVSTASALECLTSKPKGVGRFFSLKERAILESDPEGEGPADTETEAIQLSDLHAKLYVSERGRDAHIWTGSANATAAAFSGNVEFLVELVGPRKRFGIDVLMEPSKGEVRFINLLTDANTFVARSPLDPALEALEERLESLRQQIAAASFGTTVRQVAHASFDIELSCGAETPVTISSDVVARCWPITLPDTAGVRIAKQLGPGPVAVFAGATFQAITSFFAFEVAGQVNGEERRLRFVLNVPLHGAPEGRREQVLRSLVANRSTMMRFLWLLLADAGVAVPEPATFEPAESERGNRSPAMLSSGLFEMLLRNLDRAPERLDNLQGLLTELRRGADGEDLLPEGFDTVWEPIWRQRERQRARSNA